MPAPGFQNPIPYLSETDERKSYTSLFLSTATFKSVVDATFASIKWSQCTVEGTATCGLPACINCNRAI